jgi:hypothetical protein
MAKANDITELEELDVEDIEEEEEAVTLTPAILAEQLGIDPKRLRSWLRANHPRPLEVKGSSWRISDKVAAAAMAYFENLADDGDEAEDSDEE